MADGQLCPKCGSPMVMRTAKKGPNMGRRFYGCSTYPVCMATVNIIETAEVPTGLPENVNPIIDNDIKINEGKLKERINTYTQFASDKRGISVLQDKVAALFSDVSIRDHVLEPFRSLFAESENEEEKIRGVITQTAVVNAVMAGSQGNGAAQADINIAMEAYMAFVIAKQTGVEIPEPQNILKYFGPLAVILTSVLWIFKVILGVLFASFSAALPSINPLIFAEIIVTDFTGVVLRAGFQQEKITGKFTMPAATGTVLMDETKKIGEEQMKTVIALLKPANTALCGERLKKYFS